MGRPPNKQIDSLILIQLYEDPTMSCREIAKATQIPYSPVRYVLINRLRYKCYNLKWIPHFVDSDLKKNCVEYCQRMIVILEKCQNKNFRYLLTGDESWFCYFTPHGCQWVDEDDQVPKRVRPNIQNPKIMITLFWNVNGIVILDVLKKGINMNSTIFISNILEPLTKYPQFVEAKKAGKNL